MNFVSSVLNQIPVVGHVKAGIHLLAGDSDGAGAAFRQSTRSTAVCVGGLTGGPLGAVGAGLAADAIMTVGTQEPQGVIRSVCKVGKDINNGKVPIMSTIETVLTPACDAIGGQAAGEVLQSAAKIYVAAAPELAKESAKIAVKSTVKKIIVTEAVVIAENIGTASVPVMCEAVRDMTEKPTRRFGFNYDSGYSSSSGSGTSGSSTTNTSGGRSNSSSSSSKTEDNKSTGSAAGGTSSGGGPPNNPPSGNTKTKTKDELVKELLDILKTLFPNMSSHESNRLRLLLNAIIDHGFDMRILVIALSMCKKVNVDYDIMMFASMAEFVMTYVGEQLFELTESVPADSDINIEQLRGSIILNLMCTTYIQSSLLDLFKEFFTDVVKLIFGTLPTFEDLMTFFNPILETIRAHPGHSRFRDVYSAIYHYYKHRKVVSKWTGEVRILTVEEFFDLIEHIYQEIQYTTLYVRMKKTQRGEITEPALTVYGIIHISTFERYGRHFKLVLKLQNGQIVVASLHWVDYNKK